MRLFAKVAEAKSFTAAARALGIPKQTLSRRVAELERALGVQLMQRTTRRLIVSDAGAAYAERCAEMLRLADEANRLVVDANDVPRGVLRVTADPVFGEAFLGGVLVEYARAWPDVRVEIVLTRRRVDLVEERFDVAFRVGEVGVTSLAGFRLGPARVRYCASRSYVAKHGAPRTPEQLEAHACIVVGDDASVRWPFRGPGGMRLVPVSGALVSTSFAIAHAAALAGLGIAIFPEFACDEDIRRGRLVPVLDEWVVDVGSLWLLHAAGRPPPARVRAFAELARARLTRSRIARGACALTSAHSVPDPTHRRRPRRDR
jgi:DNA-binding transcriptional LysR family regulator